MNCVLDKMQSTNISTKGVKWASQHPPNRNKAKQTFIKKYGVDHPSKSKEISAVIQQKARETWCNNLGVDNPSKSDDIKHKKKITSNTNFGVDYHAQRNLLASTIRILYDYDNMYKLHILQKKSIVQISVELQCNQTTVSRHLDKLKIPKQQYHHTSVGECEVREFLNDNGVETINNDRTTISPYELDIYIPTHNIAIEYCGLYWHSEQQGKDKHYHKRKHDLCKMKGIQLITIYEDEWKQHQMQVMQKLLSLCHISPQTTVFARKTKVCLVSTIEKREFFENHHIQGDGPGSINIGLMYDDVLIACMSFVQQKDKHYLNRYATSCHVPGGFSKILSYFKKTYEWKQLISFADNRWSDGNLYSTTGWILDSMLPPDYYYSPDGHTRYHKFGYRRKYLATKLDNFDPTLSERINCDNNGILRIWDCGKMRFVINK